MQIIFRGKWIEVILKENDKEEEGLNSWNKIYLFSFKHSDVSALKNNWGKNKTERGFGCFGDF